MLIMKNLTRSISPHSHWPGSNCQTIGEIKLLIMAEIMIAGIFLRCGNKNHLIKRLKLILPPEMQGFSLYPGMNFLEKND